MNGIEYRKGQLEGGEYRNVDLEEKNRVRRKMKVDECKRLLEGI